MKTVCLFDIDGTLLNSGGAGQDAMEKALAKVFSVGGPYQDIRAAGRTDFAITSDLFVHHGLLVDEALRSRFLTEYCEQLPASLTAMNGAVLPGVPELLQRLDDRDDVALGLLTGNFEVGAQLKLQHYALDHYFQFGGYGDDHHDRDDVARLAHTAACTFLNASVEADRVWVIGDTPSDVKCGRAIGARVLAVATGIFSQEELRASRPDCLFEDLSDVDQIFQILVGGKQVRE